MKGLGFLEETLLLLVLSMEDDAYGNSVQQAYQAHTGKSISLSAIHTALGRLEEKGLLQSEMAGATPERGGRRKRIFTATATAVEVLAEIKASRQSLWAKVPKL